MILRKWEELPSEFRNESVRKYYDILSKKKFSLYTKRIFDIVGSVVAITILIPLFIFISIAIKLDSEGPIIFRQVRITKYGKKFNILKFRTMIINAERLGSQVTTMNDTRITKVGKVLRKLRLDEVPQLVNIISGDMSFVGTRPEVCKYVDGYTNVMKATLLMPAGVTSVTSILFKDEELLLAGSEDVDKKYLFDVLPLKMEYNLKSIENFSFFSEISILFRTVFAVIK
ncbi:sugar transferase [Paenibacillus sp. Soil750]|uniref:sugar transferase n=1 Tax=Paenibacillus sp. Soil750 TaxID=1736398 RepID=UPI0006F401AC|nr:sugar transferase [Paenibacillus sp. Soil750]KRE57660.1 glycosyl transferase [Paenibacillus sp. Soil750]